MSEMLERVAQTIALLGPDITAKGRRELIWPDDWAPDEQAAILTQAYAAIAAMREPTRVMIDAARAEYAGDLDGEEIRDLWRAMVDRALSDKP